MVHGDWVERAEEETDDGDGDGAADEGGEEPDHYFEAAGSGTLKVSERA